MVYYPAIAEHCSMNKEVSSDLKVVPQSNIQKRMEDEVKKNLPQKIRTTEENQKKLHAGLKFVMYFFTNTPYIYEKHFSWHHEYHERKVNYIVHDIVEEQQSVFGGYRHIMFVFVIDDKYVRKRVEKLLKLKPQWNVWKYEQDKPENYLSLIP